MEQEDIDVLGAVAALSEREEEATVDAIASETGLPAMTVNAVLSWLWNNGHVMRKPFAYFRNGEGIPPHVEAYTVTDKGQGALKK